MLDILPHNSGARNTGGEFMFDEKRHYYTLDGRPLVGTTTALSILDKSGLTWWSSGMACEVFGWKNPKKFPKDECEKAALEGLAKIQSITSPKDYLKLLDQAYRAHNTRKKDSAVEGTDLHAVLEDFIKCRMAGREPLFIDPRIKDFVTFSDKHIKKFLFTEMCCYSRVVWVGGTADFGYIDNDDLFVLGDFKSSEKAYFGHFVQVGGYDLQITENGGFTKDGKRILDPMKFDYHAIFAARGGLDKPFYNYELGRVKRAFSCAVQLYQEKLFWEDEK